MKKVVLLFCTLTLSFSISVSAQSENSLPEMQEDCLWITSGQMERGKSMPIFNKAFTVGKKPHKTVLQVTALGIYDVVINGQTVGQHELKPGWTDYRKEVTFQTFDITSLLRKGENEISVQLSRGWWSGGISRGVYGKDLPLALKARIVSDGRCIAATDTTWLYSLTGPLLEGDIYCDTGGQSPCVTCYMFCPAKVHNSCESCKKNERFFARGCQTVLFEALVFR